MDEFPLKILDNSNPTLLPELLIQTSGITEEYRFGNEGQTPNSSVSLSPQQSENEDKSPLRVDETGHSWKLPSSLLPALLDKTGESHRIKEEALLATAGPETKKTPLHAPKLDEKKCHCPSNEKSHLDEKNSKSSKLPGRKPPKRKRNKKINACQRCKKHRKKCTSVQTNEYPCARCKQCKDDKYEESCSPGKKI